MIDVFVWPGERPGARGFAREGFNLERMAAGGLEFWIVSDLNRNELADLARLLASRAGAS
jgi:hypothetical protein